MLEILKRFVKEELAYITQQDDIQFIYDVNGELVGEIHMEQGFISHIDFYDADMLAEEGIPFSNSAMINAVLRPNEVTEEVEAAAIPHIAREMKEALDDRALQLDSVIDFDVNYLAIFEEVELRYGLTIPNTGLQLAIRRDGTLSSATFMRQPFTIIYPEEMIPKAEARRILTEEQLVQLSIKPEEWEYAYVPTFDVYGVEADGRVKRLGGKARYEALPEVEPIDSLEAFLQGGRPASVPLEEEEDSYYWEYPEQENLVQSLLEESSFQRACRTLQGIVGSWYRNYQLEHVEELPAELSIYLQHTSEKSVTYRFVYCHEGVYLPEHAAEITVHQTTGQIEGVTLPKIPFEKLMAIQPPIITLEAANTAAKKLVDVRLSMERIDMGDNLYTSVYLMEYPSSPTQGEIESIDAYTGEIRFVETGLMKIDE